MGFVEIGSKYIDAYSVVAIEPSYSNASKCRVLMQGEVSLLADCSPHEMLGKVVAARQENEGRL